MRYAVFFNRKASQRNWIENRIHRVVQEGKAYRTLCGRLREGHDLIFVKDSWVDGRTNLCQVCFSEAADESLEGIETAERLMLPSQGTPSP